ncbi:hypothetical protein MW871_11130 [Flavobacterium sp. I-SCBP12n]|uniref:Right handed beta helix domain-containing protein n=1 Tax=Flavobacterium pygoscelis TaxID=2893176 RepID=A0A9X1XS06_9FLAO|nr:hypothetical protein [Flavobacterium pygoscelis]MCK8142445.1 hypothetical protein [Flavobacterium pygoscelis]
MKKYYLIIGLFFSLMSYAQGNYTITNLNDDGAIGSLRYAIENTTATTIDFDLNLMGTLTLTGNLPNISRDLTITGNGTSNLILSGNNSYKMFQVTNGALLTISNITFTKNAAGMGSIFRAQNNNSAVMASNINIIDNVNTYAFYTNDSSTITISNSTFISNSSVLFGSNYGSTPNTTSDIETDYSNRITVLGCTFTANSGTIFNTERYVKIDNCNFYNNTGQIGNFRGLNRYQVLNSTFINNSAGSLFSFYSDIVYGTFLATLGTNQHLFEGNTFKDNSGTIINTGSVNEQSLTTIKNNIFINNGTTYSGTPAVIINNSLDNFFNSIVHYVSQSTVSITMNRPVFNTNSGIGDLETTDFELSIVGGNAILASQSPSNISSSGNTYTLGIALLGEISGEEVLTVSPVTNSIFDGSFNIASNIQINNSVKLNFLDDDSDGVSNFLDLCPNTQAGVRVYPNNGCEDTTYPFITYFDYNSYSINYLNNFTSTTNHNLYFLSYDNNWNSSLKKLTPQKVLSDIFSSTELNLEKLTTDGSNNIFISCYNNTSGNYQIKKINQEAAVETIYSFNNEYYIQDFTVDKLGVVYLFLYNNSTNSRSLKKINSDGTLITLENNSIGYYQYLTIDGLGNLYFVYNDNNFSTIRKMTSDGNISDFYTDNNTYIQNFKFDSLGNMYIVSNNNMSNFYQIKKISNTGIATDLFTLNDGYIQNIAINTMGSLYFSTYNFITNERAINIRSDDGIIVSYSDFLGQELYNDSFGNIYFSDNQNKKIIATKMTTLAADLSNFAAINKYYFDQSFTIINPDSSSSGAFTFTSDNTNVATIAGNTITFTGIGTANITANQDADANYESGSISTLLTVKGSKVVSKYGVISENDTNYVNKNGSIGTVNAVDANGKEVKVKTQL